MLEIMKSYDHPPPWTTVHINDDDDDRIDLLGSIPHNGSAGTNHN